MNSAEKKKWGVVLAGPARKSLDRAPAHDRARTRAALDGMEMDPFLGDVKCLRGQDRLAGASETGGFSFAWTERSAFFMYCLSNAALRLPIKVCLAKSRAMLAERLHRSCATLAGHPYSKRG